MSAYRLQQIPTFSRQAKRRLKKYVSFKDDLGALAASLISSPHQGTPLGKDYYKIRLAIASENRGKSGGARVVTCGKVVGETVYLRAVFDKFDRDNLAEGDLDALLTEAGLTGE